MLIACSWFVLLYGLFYFYPISEPLTYARWSLYVHSLCLLYSM